MNCERFLFLFCTQVGWAQIQAIHHMLETSEIHCTNVMRLILFMSEIMDYSCEEADSESESIELHALELCS